MLPAAVQEAARKRCLPAGRRTASNPAPRLPLAQDSAHPGRPNCRRTGKRQRQTCLCNATSDDQYQPDQIGVLRNHPEQVGLRLRCSSRHVACPSARCCLCPRHCLFHATAVSAVVVIVSSTAVSLSPCGVRVCVCVCLSVLGHCLSCRECHTALVIVRANAHVCTHQVFPQQRSEPFAVLEHMPRDLSFAVRFAMSSDVMSHLIRVSGACSPHPCAPPPHPPHQAKGPHGEPLELTEGCNRGGRSSRLAGTPLFVAAARKRSHGCCVVMTS